MEYVKITNGTPKTYSIGQLRKDNPETAFAKDISDQALAEWGVRPCAVPAYPDCDPLVERVVDDGFEQDAHGNWSRKYAVVQRSQSEAESNVRDRRNVLLSAADFTQLADSQVDKAMWAAYRQALRDIPAQVGFPFSVTWPTEPE